MRNIVRSGVAVLFVTTALTAATGKLEAPHNMVRVTEATVITVHDSEATEPKTEPAKRQRIRRGASAVSQRAVRVAGWMMNVSDDIPSARERTARRTTATR